MTTKRIEPISRNLERRSDAEKTHWTVIERLASSLDHSELQDFLETYNNPRKRMIANFTAGLFRGIGMTLGTALFLALLGFTLTFFIDMPIIGQYVANLLDYIDKYR